MGGNITFYTKLVIVYLVLTICFIISIIGITCIPLNAIKGNVVLSGNILKQEGLYPVSFGNNYSSLSFLGRDQYTDCLMLNLAVSSNGNSAIEDAILNPCYKGGYNLDEWPDNLRKLSNGEIKPDTNYDWYWHGYLVILKPLLVLFNYNQIRWFNCALMAILFCWVLLLIKKHLGKVSSLLFMGIVFIMHGETIPYTMQYASVFFVTLIALIILLSYKAFFTRNNNDLLAFFTIGAVTVYVDFLTTPIVTLGIPVLFWLLAEGSDNKVRKLIILSLMWGLGYALLWMTKWGLCALTFDPSVLENAASHADKWSGNDPTNGRLFMTIGVIKKYLALLWSMNWAWGVISAIFAMCILPKVEKWWSKNAWLLLVACMPFAWSFVLVNHNYEHFGFTWRNIVVCLLALSFWLYKSIDWKNLKYHG